MINVQSIKNLVNSDYEETSINWHLFDSINSTQTFLKEKITLNKDIFDICIASSQLLGKGQKNNYWHSPENCGLWVSIGTIVQSLKHPWALSIAAVIAQTLEKENIQLQLKWPNDMFIQNKKCGGILIDIKTKNNYHELIVGLGLNINNNNLLPKSATFLTNHANIKKPNILCAKIILKIINHLKNPITNWLEYCNKNLYLKNDFIEIKTTEKSFFGRLTRISDDGAIVLNEKNKFYTGSIYKISK